VIEVRISGAEQIHALARHIKELGDAGLGRQMAAALTRAVDPVGKAINAEASKVSPSGYRETLTRSLQHRRAVRNSRTQASVRLTTTGKGKQESRDLPSLNAGNLRHPVFGRRKDPWHVTRIASGFYDRGTEKAADEAETQLLVVLDDFTQRLSEE
jgi:hypothetical protein